MATLKITAKNGKTYEYEKKWIMIDVDTWVGLATFASEHDMSLHKAIKKLLKERK